MAPALVLRLEPELEDLVREPVGDDASAHREDIGVVVLARQPRGVEIVAERGAYAWHLVGGDLLALAAAAEHDAAIGAPLDDRATDGETDRRVVDRLLAVGAEILDGVAEAGERVLEVLFQQKAGVIRADSDTHSQRLYYVVRGSSFGVRSSTNRTTHGELRTTNVTGMVPTVVISPRGEERLRSGHPW